MAGNRSKSTPPQSRAFFFEMLLNMIIFALCATVALQVFVESKLTIDKSESLNQLTLRAESLAEAYKSTNGEITDLAKTLGIKPDGQPVVEYYDLELNPSSESDAKYSLVCKINKQQPLSIGTITAYESETELFTFEVKNYQPRKVGS
jgi:type II secretory pathway pseudopilin PulG